MQRMCRNKHRGAVQGITGSCYELLVGDDHSILVDCDFFQGAGVSGSGVRSNHLKIEFDVAAIKALFVTHVYIDHIGRPTVLFVGNRA